MCGIKPTYNRISVDGVVPLAPSMDHVGLMANCVKDLAILFAAINDPFPTFSVQAATAEPEHPPCLGRLGGLYAERAEPVMQNAMVVATNKWREAGTKIITIDPPTAQADVTRQHAIIMAVEAAEVHEQRIKHHPGDYPPRITSLVQEGLHTSATDYVRSLRQKDQLTDALVEQLELSGAHVFLTPATIGSRWCRPTRLATRCSTRRGATRACQ